MTSFKRTTHKTFRSILCFIMVVVSLTVFVFFTINLLRVKNETDEQIRSMEQDILNIAQNDIETILDQTVLINAALTGIDTTGLRIGTGEELYNRYSSLLNQITLCISMFDYIDSIVLENEAFEISKGSISYQPDKMTAIGTHKNCTLYISRNIENSKPVLLLKQTASDVTDNDVLLSISGRNLGKSLFGSYQPAQRMLITDKTGNIIISNRNDFIGDNLFSLFDLEESSLEDNYSKVILEGEGYLFSSTKLDHAELYCVRLTAHTVYNSYTEPLQRKNILLATILIVISILLTSLLTHIAYRPLHKLMETAYSYYPLAIEESCDEIAAIQHIFKNTHQEKVDLLKEIESNSEELKRQQILALQAQISPHFISNVLDSINWMSISMNGYDNPVSNCIQSTRTIFFYCMNYSTIFSSLRQELKIAREMVAILSAQFHLTIRIVEDIPPELMEYKLLKLCLEPIFENSIIHGYANHATEGEIHISARFDDNGNEILVSIRDFGIGMTPAELEVLQNSIHDSLYHTDGHHIGLRNVNHRLELLFGESYRLEIESQKDKGTTFILRIPNIQ